MTVWQQSETYMVYHNLVKVRVYNRDPEMSNTVWVFRRGSINAVLRVDVGSAAPRWRAWWLRWLPVRFNPRYAEWASEVFPIVALDKGDIYWGLDRFSPHVTVEFDWMEPNG